MFRLFWFMIVVCISISSNVYAKDRDYRFLTAPFSGTVTNVYLQAGKELSLGDNIHAGDLLVQIKNSKRGKIEIKANNAGNVRFIGPKFKKHQKVTKGEVLLSYEILDFEISNSQSSVTTERLSISNIVNNLKESTGIYDIIKQSELNWADGIGRVLMIFIGLLLLYLGIAKGFEPLLLIPIGMGGILANIPLAFINDPGGILYYVYHVGIETGVFPLIIFMGVGAMTDFGPMLANPITMLLGAAAQVGIFGTLVGAMLLSKYIPGIEFSLQDASAISIIGGADGPTSIFVASKLAPHLLGSIAVAAYSYMALVPIIQPPIMKFFTSKDERQIQMTQLRYVSKREKIIFPILVLLVCAFFLPSAAPLIGFLMFGNLMKECGVVERLSGTVQNSLINIVTIFLGLGVGSKLSAEKFLNVETLGIVVLGLIAFSAGTTGGLFMAKFINLFKKNKINPLIGAAGVSAVPMAARVANKVGLDENPNNFLLMHAMGPNVAGVLGSAVAAGVLLAVFL